MGTRSQGVCESGQIVSNLVVVHPTSSGQVTSYNHSGSTELVVDLEGIFSPTTNAQLF